MLNKINDEIKKSMISKNQLRLSVLKMVKSEIINNDKSQKPKPHISVVVSYRKKISSTIELNKSHGIDVSSLEQELDVVKSLLPSDPTDDEILNYANSINQPNKNLLLKDVLAKFPTADGSLISKLILGSKQ